MTESSGCFESYLTACGDDEVELQGELEDSDWKTPATQGDETFAAASATSSVLASPACAKV